MKPCPRTTRLIAVAGLAFSATAFATTRNWINAAGGAASNSANWSPVGVPVAADILNYTTAGVYSIIFDAAVPIDSQNNFNAGTISISATSPHTTTSQFVAGISSNSTLNITGGQFSVGGPLVVASGATTSTLTLTGPTTSVLGTNVASQFRIGNGAGANGTMNILNGALMQHVGSITVGSFGGAPGTLLVSGLNGATHSRLITTDPVAGDITVGVAGNGSMTVTNGGQVTCADDFSVAPNAGFTGSVSVGTNTASQLLVSGDLLVGNNATAAAAGTGTLHVQLAAFVSVGGTTRVGDADGGTGTLRISGNTQFTTRGLVFDSTHGSFIHEDGIVRVDGSPCVLPTPSLTINGLLATSSPVLSINSGSTMDVGGTITVGSSRMGTLRVIGNAAVVTPGLGTGINLGDLPGSDGTMEVSTFGRVANPGSVQLLVGRNGSGTLDINSGGRVDALGCSIGSNVGSNGVASIVGAGSILNLVGGFTVGGNGATPGGTGLCNIDSSGLVSAGSATIWNGTGSLNINGGTLTSSGVLNVPGTINMTNGTIVASTMTIANTTNITASGRINALISGIAASSQVTLNGPLEFGPSSTHNFSFTGRLNVGANALTIRENTVSPSRLGDVTISGGSISHFGPNHSFSLANGDSLTGFGTINSPLTFVSGPTVTATGTGLTFNGLLTPLISSTFSIAGTKATFGPSGGLTGAGTISTQVLNSGVITATGTLTLGNGSALGVDTQSGTLNVGPHHVTLNDSNGLTLGHCTIGGGNLELVGSVSGRNLSTLLGDLKGFGTVTTPKFSNLGLTAPGSNGETGTGLLTFTGDFTCRELFQPPGAINIDLQGQNAFDRLNIAGNATVDGTLNVTLAANFTPSPGTRFPFLNAASVNGNFTIVSVPPGSTLLYTPTTVEVLFPCPADFNRDGTVDFFDYLDFVDAFSANDPASDFNNDSAIDFFDYLDFVDAFSAGC